MATGCLRKAGRSTLNSACLTLSKEHDWSIKRAGEIRTQCYALRDSLRKANSPSSNGISTSRYSNNAGKNQAVSGGGSSDASQQAAEAERQRVARYWEQRAAEERQQQLAAQRKAERRSQTTAAVGAAAISIFNAREQRREAELARREMEDNRRQATAQNAFASLGSEMQGASARGNTNPYIGQPCRYFTGAAKTHRSGMSIAYEGDVYKCLNAKWTLIGPAWSVDDSTYKTAEEAEK